MKQTLIILIVGFIILTSIGCTDRCHRVGDSGGCSSTFPYSCGDSDMCYRSMDACEKSSSCN